MAPPAAAHTPTATHERKSAHKGHGQWALGHLEPLTPNERVKKDDDGLNVRARIENIYAQRGFASIDPADLRGRFRWWGLYTQRRPGIDGGKTAVLEPHELDDEYFMLRVRIDGGRLTTEQLRVIAEVSQEFGRDTADITDRQNVQLHWIRVEDVPEIWRRLESVGLSTTEACGDTPRVILGSPVAGIAADEIIDGTPAIDEIQRAVHRLPGVLQPPPQVQDRDQRVAAAGRRARGQRHLVRRRRAPRARPGLRPVGRRRPVDQPDARPAARRVGAAGRGPGGVGRSRRRLPRLRLPPAAHPRAHQVPHRGLGSRAVPRGARERVPRPRASSTARPRPCPTAARDHVGVHRQQDGRYYVGLAPTVGRVSGTTLVRLAEVAEAHGSTRVRTHAAPEAGRPRRTGRAGRRAGRRHGGLGLNARPSTFRRGTMACTGIEFCKLAIVETKSRAAKLIDELESRLPDLDQPLVGQRQRLPELLRPHPDRRHRPQGPAGPRRRRAAGGGLPGPPRRRRSASTPASAASCAATR